MAKAKPKRKSSSKSDNTGLEVIGGVAAGAAAGSLLGPLGAAVGAVVGGAVGPKVAEADYSKPTAKVKKVVGPAVKAISKRLHSAAGGGNKKGTALAGTARKRSKPKRKAGAAAKSTLANRRAKPTKSR